MADIFQEIDDELRQDRAARIWKKYGKYAIGVAILILVAVGGYRFWQEKESTQLSEDSASYSSAINLAEKGRVEESMKIIDRLAAKGSYGYAILARFQQAVLFGHKKDDAAAVKALRNIADDPDIPIIFKEFADIQLAIYQYAESDPGQLISRLESVGQLGSPWYPFVQETKALMLIKMGDNAGAKLIFKELADADGTPTRMRVRVSEILMALPE